MEWLTVSNAVLSSILKEDAEVTGIGGEKQVIGNFEESCSSVMMGTETGLEKFSEVIVRKVSVEGEWDEASNQGDVNYRGDNVGRRGLDEMRWEEVQLAVFNDYYYYYIVAFYKMQKITQSDICIIFIVMDVTYFHVFFLSD